MKVIGVAYFSISESYIALKKFMKCAIHPFMRCHAELLHNAESMKNDIMNPKYIYDTLELFVALNSTTDSLYGCAGELSEFTHNTEYSQNAFNLINSATHAIDEACSIIILMYGKLSIMSSGTEMPEYTVEKYSEEFEKYLQMYNLLCECKKSITYMMRDYNKIILQSRRAFPDYASPKYIWNIYYFNKNMYDWKVPKLKHYRKMLKIKWWLVLIILIFIAIAIAQLGDIYSWW